MLTVIPTINCAREDAECVKERLLRVEPFAEWVHVDVADGIFTHAKSWDDPHMWQERNTKLRTEVHLMVEHPEKFAEEWLHAGAARIIFHYEAFPRARANPEKLRVRAIETILHLCAKYDAEAMLAVNPETKLDHLPHHLARFKAFQVFAQAVPGPAGQPFLRSVLPNIRALRERFPNATIEVDGGMNAETARLAKDAGADTIVCGSYILNAKDPRAAYEALRAL